MSRGEVRIIRSRFVPFGANTWAWVPWPNTILVKPGVALTRSFIAHELSHVLQWRRLGPLFPIAYLVAWVLARFQYADNYFEARAWEAAIDPFMLAWAERTIAAHQVQ